MAQGFFSYDPDGFGIEFHDTEDAARKAADSALEQERDNASEGWGENVTQICFGVVLGRVTETSRRPATEGKDYDEEVEYELLPETK